MELQLALSGSRCTESLARWLSGENPARTIMSESLQAKVAGGEVKISFHKGDILTFSPSWLLTAEGSALVRVSRRDGKLSGSTIDISLLAPDEPSLMRNPVRKRTQIEVLRRDAAWNVKADIGLPKGTSLSAVNGSFDKAQVETGEGKDRVARGVLLFESLNAKPTLVCRTNTHPDSLAGVPFALALQGARYAFTLNESKKHVAVLANFSNQTRHLQISECALRVGAGAHTQRFEVVALDGKLQTVKCAPDLLDVSVPLGGASSVIARRPANTKLDRRIQRLVATIDHSPQQRVSLDDMARIASLSPSRLRHKFKSQVGVTPTVYLQNARLKLAERLLKDGNLSVKEVRAAVGFESDSYFTHLCERVYGRSPLQMKNLWPMADGNSDISNPSK
jgi:AraC-like DNA-binding protein